MTVTINEEERIETPPNQAEIHAAPVVGRWVWIRDALNSLLFILIVLALLSLAFSPGIHRP
jgi:hypothetical protein